MFLKCQNFPNCFRFSPKKNVQVWTALSFLLFFRGSRSFSLISSAVFFFAFSAFWVNAVPFFTSSRTYVILSYCITFATFTFLFALVQLHFVPQVEVSNGLFSIRNIYVSFETTRLEHDLPEYHECNAAVFHDTFDKSLHFARLTLSHHSRLSMNDVFTSMHTACPSVHFSPHNKRMTPTPRLFLLRSPKKREEKYHQHPYDKLIFVTDFQISKF